jgi:hypothetical protein
MISEMSIKHLPGVTEKNNEECHMYNYCAVELEFSYFPINVKNIIVSNKVLIQVQCLVDKT